MRNLRSVPGGRTAGGRRQRRTVSSDEHNRLEMITMIAEDRTQKDLDLRAS